MSGLDQAALALGKVSRACRYSELPTVVWVLNTIPRFRWELPGAGAYEPLPVDNGDYCFNGSRCRQWALESFTTHYFNWWQYHLWVSAETWSASRPYMLRYQTLDVNSYFPFREYHSGWASDWKKSELPGLLGLTLYRARAGTGSYPYFFENLGGDLSFKIKGWHFFYDPESRQMGSIGTSNMTDHCNLQQWGFESEIP